MCFNFLSHSLTVLLPLPSTVLKVSVLVCPESRLDSGHLYPDRRALQRLLSAFPVAARPLFSLRELPVGAWDEDFLAQLLHG